MFFKGFCITFIAISLMAILIMGISYIGYHRGETNLTPEETADRVLDWTERYDREIQRRLQHE